MTIFDMLRYITGHPLNRGRKTAAILRFLKWQIRARLSPGPMLVPWVGGARMLVRRSDYGFTGNIYCGLHDVAEMSYLLHVLSPSDVFVDVGANLGAYTVLACGVKGARGFSFEPVPSTFARLKDNIALNSLDERVTALNIGLAENDGELLFTAEQDCMNHVIQNSESKEGAIMVPVRRLDSVLTGEAATVMKIDVEGFEAPVLKGAASVLGNPSLHSILMELNGSGMQYGFDDAWIIQFVRDFGFSPYEYNPFTRELTAIDGKTDSSPNTIFIRGVERAAQQVKNAPRIQVGRTSI